MAARNVARNQYYLDEGTKLQGIAVARRELAAGNPQWAYVAAKESGMSPGTVRRWVRQERDRVIQNAVLANDGVSPTEILQILDAAGLPPIDPFVTFIDQKITKVDVWEALRVAEEVQQIVHSTRPGQHSAKVRVTTDEPYVLGLAADWHLWSIATDHKAFQRDLRYVLSADHLGIVDLGDGFDNFHKFKSIKAVVDQVFPPDVQKALFTKILAELAKQKKLLARCWSNHVEGFDESVYGGSIEEFNKLCPYLEDDGDITIEVGNDEHGYAEYVISAKHIPKGTSMYHENHANKRIVKFQKPHVDIAVSAHRHNGPEIDNYKYAGQQRLAIVLGSYKTEDAHSRRFHEPSVPGMVGVVLAPHRKEMTAFLHLDQAVEYRDAVAVRKKESA